MGGAQRYVYDLATSKLALNYQVTVAIGKSVSRTLVGKLQAQNIKVIELKHLSRSISPIDDFKSLSEVKKLYQETKPDIVHLNSTKAGVIGSIAAGFNHPFKLIYTAHGWVFNEPINLVKKFIYLIAEKISSVIRNKIICVSDYDRRVAIKYRVTKSDKLINIYNGIQPQLEKSLSKKESRAILGLPEDITIVGTIANLYATKGLEYFIKSIDWLVHKNGNNIMAVVIGDGTLKDDLTKLIKKYKLQKHFLLLGSKDNAHQYLRAFDVYISSSVKEGLPYSILEAMRSKVPVIATTVGGIPEMIENNTNGLLVPSKDSKALAKAILKIVDSHDDEYGLNLGRNAKQTVQEKFSIDLMIQQTFDQYK